MGDTEITHKEILKNLHGRGLLRERSTPSHRVVISKNSMDSNCIMGLILVLVVFRHMPRQHITARSYHPFIPGMDSGQTPLHFANQLRIMLSATILGFDFFVRTRMTRRSSILVFREAFTKIAVVLGTYNFTHAIQITTSTPTLSRFHKTRQWLSETRNLHTWMIQMDLASTSGEWSVWTNKLSIETTFEELFSNLFRC